MTQESRKQHQAHILIDKYNKYTRLSYYNMKGWKASNRSFSVAVNVKELQKRIRFILSLCCDVPSSVNVRFCDIEEMLEANRNYRQKNKPTDILSFPGDAILGQEEGLYFLGDLLICLPVCLYQAREARISLAAEILRMLVHGICHLKGFDHERSEAAWKVQTGLERLIRKEVTTAFPDNTWLQWEDA